MARAERRALGRLGVGVEAAAADEALARVAPVAGSARLTLGLRAEPGDSAKGAVRARDRCGGSSWAIVPFGAQAVARGAASVDGVESLLISVDDIDQHWDTLENVDGIIFGAPTYMGSASAQFKGFMDATSRNVFAKGGKWANKVAAGFTNSASRSGDKLATLQQIAIFSAQHGMHWVNLGLPPGHNNSKSTEDSLNRHGFFLGAAAQSNADESADVVPPPAPRQAALEDSEIFYL